MRTSTATDTDTELAAAVRIVVGKLYRQFRQNQDGGLTPSQLSTLVTLEERGPIRLGELAEIEGVHASTLTKGINNLEGRGIVARTVDPQDRRSSFVAITSAGRQLLDDLRDIRTARFARRIALLEPRQRRILQESVAVLQELMMALPDETP